MDFFLSRLTTDTPCLLLWSNSSSSQQQVETVTKIREHLQYTELLLLEHTDRLTLVQHTKSSYHTVMIGAVPPHVTDISFDLLAEVTCVLEPSGQLLLQQVVTEKPVSGLMTQEKLLSQLKLAGFIDPVCSVREMEMDEKIRAVESAATIRIEIRDKIDLLHYVQVSITRCKYVLISHNVFALLLLLLSR